MLQALQAQQEIGKKLDHVAVSDGRQRSQLPAQRQAAAQTVKVLEDGVLAGRRGLLLQPFVQTFGAQQIPDAAALHQHLSKPGTVIDTGVQVGALLQAAVKKTGKLCGDVAHPVTHPHGANRSFFINHSGETGKGVGTVDHPGGWTLLFHGAGKLQKNGHVAQQPQESTWPHGVPYRVEYTIFFRHLQIYPHGLEPTGRNRHHDKIGALQCHRRGSGRDELSPPSGQSPQLFGQFQIHLQGGGIDIVQHHLAAIEVRIEQQPLQHLGPPAVTAAAHQHHL